MFYIVELQNINSDQTTQKKTNIAMWELLMGLNQVTEKEVNSNIN